MLTMKPCMCFCSCRCSQLTPIDRNHRPATPARISTCYAALSIQKDIRKHTMQMNMKLSVFLVLLSLAGMLLSLPPISTAGSSISCSSCSAAPCMHACII